MGALTIAFDTTIVGALALPWVVLVVHLFFSEGENRIKDGLQWVKDQGAQAAAGVLLFAMTYTLGSAVSRIAQDFFNDDDLYYQVGGHLLRIGVTEDHILTRLYCDTSDDSKLLRAEPGDPALAEAIKNFRTQKALCAQPLRWWVRPKHHRTLDNFIGIAADILGLQENALMSKGGDFTVRLRQIHDQVMVLRGAAFNGVIGFSLCLFAWGAMLQREKPGSWLRWAVMPVPVLYLGAALIAVTHHFKEGLPPDPPYMEFTLSLLGLVGAWLLWKRPSSQLSEKPHHPTESPANSPAKKAGEEKETAAKETGTKDFWHKERWAQMVVLSGILSLAAGLGWWSTEVFYAQQVIYSYGSQSSDSGASRN
jgi:hypothetical protein